MRRYTVPVLITITTALLSGCNGGGTGDRAGDDGGRPEKIEVPYADAEVTVEGTRLTGFGPQSYTCQNTPGQAVILTGKPGPQEGGLGMTLTKDEPRTVQSFSFSADGVRYSAANNRPKTTAVLTRDGDRFTIEGTAQSWDIEPPLFKAFTASLTCKQPN